MGKTYKKKTTLAVDWATKVRVYPTLSRLPKLEDFLRATAVYWEIPISEITPEIMKAHLRHSATNYEARVAELSAMNRKHRLSEGDKYVARNLLKLSAIETAENLFLKIVRHERLRGTCSDE